MHAAFMSIELKDRLEYKLQDESVRFRNEPHREMRLVTQSLESKKGT